MVFNPRYPITNPCAEIFLGPPNNLIMSFPEYNVIDKGAIVDGEKWFTVLVGKEAAAWIRTQDRVLWAETAGPFYESVFDIHNELMLLIKLKWQK